MKINYGKQSAELAALDIKVADSVQATNVLILSAHSGDELLGCGGLISHLSESASHIKVIYFSDKLEFVNEKKIDAESMRIQEREAVSGLRVLGIHEVNFLRMKEVLGQESISLTILEELKTREWDLVILPSKEDWSIERQAINTYFESVSKYKLGYPLVVMQYGLFGLSKPDIVLNIDQYVGMKEEAVRCHKSLLAQRDLASASLGLSNYLGNIAGVGKHVEGYSLSTK